MLLPSYRKNIAKVAIVAALLVPLATYAVNEQYTRDGTSCGGVGKDPINFLTLTPLIS